MSKSRYFGLPDIDLSYVVQGKASPWGDMVGGAKQIVTPFAGDTMKKLGILKEVLK